MRKLIRGGDYGEPVIVVSGLPRSGTSMAMQMLAAAGIPVVTDGVRKPGEDNPKGYFEDERVKQLHKEHEDGSWLMDARGKAVKIISFLLKDLPDTVDYKVVFMRRDLNEVLASQKKMLERRGQPDDTPEDKMFEIWTDHLGRVADFFKNAEHIESLDVDYHEVVGNPLDQARRIADFVGGDLDAETMARAVDGELYRNRNRV